MSHAPIGPRGPFKQLVESLMHSLMADRSSSLVSGLHAVTGSIRGKSRVRIKKVQKDRGKIKIWVNVRFLFFVALVKRLALRCASVSDHSEISLYLQDVLA